MKDPLPNGDEFRAQVRSRFGVLPNFFCTAADAPGLIEELWGFAKSAYLDSPLPSLFKERLFVQLSRFCEIRYCIVRHVGFLVGQGRPAGDATAEPQSIEEAVALLTRAVPDAKQLEVSLSSLERLAAVVPIPEPRSELEGALFDALTILFIDPSVSGRARGAIANAVGPATLEVLTAFLAFVRIAHYWTETHPELAYESDMNALMEDHPTLGRLMLDTSEAEWAHSRQALHRALRELRNASGALRTSEERFRALVIATSDMLYCMNPDWTEMRSLDGRGYLANTTAPDADWLLRYIPPAEQERVSAAIRRAVAAKAVFELEHQVLRNDGSVGWALSRAVPIFDENNDIVEWFGAALDLTARKSAEDALRDADRRKDEFLATLAHELRNPLAPLRNGLELARQDKSANASLDGGVIEMMDRQVNLLAHLVDDLLDVSRITSGKIQLRRGIVSLQDAFAASGEASRAAIDSRHHAFITDACAEELSVDGDFDRITQVLSNLLSNAAKYTEDGGTVRFSLRKVDDEALISVVDTGIGIPADELSGIFNVFSQVQSHRARADGGLGIGLSLVRQLVAMHGGSVQASSPGEGRGSTFTVRLPLTASAAAKPAPETAATADVTAVKRLRVLVVDDNEDAADSLAMLLRRLGHEAFTAVDGQDGVDKALELNPDIVFLDLGMPRMDGFEAAQQLRALPSAGKTTLIALTGWGQESALKQTQAAGFDHHLLKPIDPKTLKQLLAGRDGGSAPA